jgi:hypothetical protein
MPETSRRHPESLTSICIGLSGLLVLAGCVEEPVQQTTTTMEFSAEAVGVPDPVNDVEALLSEALENPEFQGTWVGEFNYFSGGVSSIYPVEIEVSKVDDHFKIKSLGYLKDQERFEDVRADGALLSFEYYGFLLTPDGDDIPMFGELVSTETGLRGVYKQKIAERGGQQYFAEFDVDLTKK